MLVLTVVADFYLCLVPSLMLQHHHMSDLCLQLHQHNEHLILVQLIYLHVLEVRVELVAYVKQ